MELGAIGPDQDNKIRSKILVDEFKWDKNDTVKIWTFGPNNTGPNVLVDQTKGI